MTEPRVPVTGAFLNKSSGRADGGAYAPGSGNGPAHYSQDRAWMQGLVVVAKNVPLWLAELSRHYVRPVQSLDAIPAEELEFLQSCGVTGIWLVGLWQRSAASATIKRKSGSAAAAPSAYAVFDYAVDEAYGGEAALATLRLKTRARGIYLGCDMVPNHTGIDSLWLREHPDWYQQTAVKPFPAYSFEGENLSPVPGVDTRVEDGYYSRRDAAVVFRHTENGRTRFIYHGNDGTGLPWNDTAQLNHTLPEVRQALIEAALRLAQNFDFIRFDAAMTLLSDHYRRLWFPTTAANAVIAGRQEHLSFDMPEFWSELVETFRRKSPGTLLIAEAFWLTENYFIRNIGMHRVYNSAFMHFLTEEKSAEFNAFMTDHLKEGETLNRFVNYLSTPDEKPAAEVFPHTEKYLGAMTLMATLPGTPLIAPGQLEGFAEKYAMDQQTPKLSETRNAGLISEHLKTIAPLFKLRSEFNDAKNLRWLQVSGDGAENHVIAYKTGSAQKYRILFNNSPRSLCINVDGDELALKPYESRVDLQPGKQHRTNMTSLQYSNSTASFPALDRRHSGVVVPVSALRSHESCGIGEFADLKLMADWCVRTGQNFIALLPVSDTGENPSPYSAVSAFALHPIYLCLADIDGANAVREEIAALQFAADSGKVYSFREILSTKLQLLRKIYDAAGEMTLPEDEWLIDYAVYKHLRAQQRVELPPLTATERRDYFAANRRDTGFYVWLQYQCDQQLSAAAEYARVRGVFIKGDLPILLERDSVDVWVNPHLFLNDLKAGAPPDQFSADGQNWGFPVYDWPAHRRDDFKWWKARVRRAAKFFSAYRIDHVLGFFRIWCLDAADSSGYCGLFLPSSALAQNELEEFLSAEKIRQLSDKVNREQPLIARGETYFPAWDFERKLQAAPLSDEERRQLRELLQTKTAGDADLQRQQGHEILSALKGASDMLPCAEDLGVVPPYVGPTLESLGILSLCVLRWRQQGENLESTRDYKHLSVATPSVHDSSNLREWLRDEGQRYYANQKVKSVLSDIYGSASALALIPLQDILALDPTLHGVPEKERINVPGTVADTNWSYRMPLYLEDLLERPDLAKKLTELIRLRAGKA
jgi:4-alpha-glucanotransferase/glycosidase